MDLKARMASKTLPLSCGCHLWVGTAFDSGYGLLRVEGKNKRAHRLAYELAHGVELDSSQLVCHHCDNPACVNPDHLFLGSSLDNTRDCMAKGRYRNRWGAVQPIDASKVEQVRQALLAGERGKDVAARFGISRSLVSRINTGKNTRWI